MDDRALIERMQKDDAAAIDAFYERYYPVFLRVAVRMTGDFHAGQDVAHDAVLKVIASVDAYVPAMAAPRTWFMTVLGNTARDWLRRVRVRWATPLGGDDGDGHALDVPDRDPTPPERAEAAEKIAAVQAALTMLDGEGRALIVLRDYEGLSAPEMAAVLGITPALVGSRLFRARGRLRTLLETNWPDLFASRGR